MSKASGRLQTLLATPGARLFALGLLVLVLLIPLGMIDGRVHERAARRDEAAAGIARSWGGEQTLAGPILRIPYTLRWRENKAEYSRSGWLYLPPDTLAIDADLVTQARRRGIFEVPVYRTAMRLSGTFLLPESSSLPVAASALDFTRAEILFAIADPRALSADTRLLWQGQALALEPSAGLDMPGVHALVNSRALADALTNGAGFEMQLALNGSSAMRLAPVARSTKVNLRSNWPHPSFDGDWLPTESRVSEEGFEAAWSISHLGRGYPPLWLDEEVTAAQINAAVFGLSLIVPVDPYAMALRIAKYGALLVLVAFAAVWVMELLGGAPLHPIQYLLLGASLCLFGLLQLALAEHLGFALAFGLAAAAIVLQASFYARAATRSTRRALVLGGLLSGWFAYLYVVLNAEDLAFLLGAGALFAALSFVMWATRKVDWSSGSKWDVASASLE